MNHVRSSEDGRHEIQVARDGKAYTGFYIVEGEAVKFEYDGKTKIAPLAGLDAQSRARILLSELVPSELSELTDPDEAFEQDDSDEDEAPDIGGRRPPKKMAPATPSEPESKWRAVADRVPLGVEADDESTLKCLGASLMLNWEEIPQDYQRVLFETATQIMSSDHSERLRHSLAVFLHDHKEHTREGQPDS